MISRMILVLALIVSMVSCTPQGDNHAPLVEANPKLPAPSVVSYVTAFPETLGTKPIEEPVIPTIVPTTTRQMMETSGLTPEPTFVKMSREEVIAEVEGLFESNGGCRLPCWWGLTPGETTLAETRIRIAPLIASSCCADNNWKSDGVTEIRLPMSEVHSIQGMVSIMVYFQNSVVRALRVDELKWPYFAVGEILEDYGPPDVIWVHTIPDFPGPNPPLSLFLFYQSKGILLYYYSLNHELVLKENIITGCFSTSPSLYMWSPKENLSIKKVGELFGQTTITYEGYPIIPLGNVSILSVNDFYMRYQGRSDDAICLEITLPDTGR